MSTTVADPNGLDLSATFAPIYWGFVVSLVLGGISIVQGYIYFLKYNDRLSIRLTAGAMLVFDFVSSALVAQSVYYYLIPHFGSLLPLNSITPELSVECLISTIITLISQLYFVKQLHAVTKPGMCWVVPVAVGLCAMFAFAFGVACTSVMFVHNHAVLTQKGTPFQIFFGLAKGFGAITDILATFAMCTFLATSRTGIKQTNSLIKSLMQFIINRGMLVTLIQTLLLIMFFAAPSHLYWLAFHVNVTKLYVNTFFAMLNARSRLHQKHAIMTADSSHNYSHRDLAFSPSRKPQLHGSDPFSRRDDIEAEDINVSEGKSFAMGTMPTVTRTVVISDL